MSNRTLVFVRILRTPRTEIAWWTNTTIQTCNMVSVVACRANEARLLLRCSVSRDGSGLVTKWTNTRIRASCRTIVRIFASCWNSSPVSTIITSYEGNLKKLLQRVVQILFFAVLLQILC